jgi:hypothetical protein
MGPPLDAFILHPSKLFVEVVAAPNRTFGDTRFALGGNSRLTS